MTRLVLGTAQFGAAYGVTNAIGRLSDDDVTGLLSSAAECGIDTFDTAADYGDSQTRLGALAPAARRYITKFSLPESGARIDAAELFGRSAETLHVDRLAGVMFHKIADLGDARAAATVEVLREARSNGLVERIGVSIYDSDDLELALSVFADLDLVQLPGNLIDGRLINSAAITDLRASGAEIHVRSALLQGILLAEPVGLPDFFAPLAPVLETLRADAAAQGTTVLGLALRYLRDHRNVDGVVVGATTTSELAAIVDEWALEGAPQPGLGADLPDELLDPRRWPKVTVTG